MSMGNTDSRIRTGNEGEGVWLECPPESRTKQEFRDECNINNVVAAHRITGQFTHVSAVMPAYGDFSNVNDYQEAVDQIKAAEVSFAQLPAKVRKRMGNDPAEFIAFLEDPANQEEAEKLGLVDAPPEEPKGPPVPPRPANEDPPKAVAPVVETTTD